MNDVRLFFRRVLRMGVNARDLAARAPTDLERLKIQGLADKRDLYASTSMLLQKVYGLLPHEVDGLTNEELEHLVDRAARVIREADERRMKRTG